MRIIDLLNKIANGEEVPNTIYYGGLEFKSTGLNYYCKKTDEFLDKHICLEDLEQEVEIIEEPQEHKIPEKLGLTLLSKGLTEIPSNEMLMNKINEIIDYLEEENGN